MNIWKEIQKTKNITWLHSNFNSGFPPGYTPGMANFHEFHPWCRDVFRLFIWQVFRFFNVFSVDIWMILGHGWQRTLKSQQNKYLTWLEDLNQEVLNNSSCNHFVEAGSVIRYPCWKFSIVCSSSRTTDS